MHHIMVPYHILRAYKDNTIDYLIFRTVNRN